MFGGAAGAEGGAFVGLDLALQYEAAEAFGGFLDAQAGHAKLPLGIEGRVGVAQAKAASGNLPDAAPLAGDDLENLAYELLCRPIALLPHRAAVLVFDQRPPAFQLPDAHQHPLQDVEGLKARHYDGHMILRGNGDVAAMGMYSW